MHQFHAEIILGVVELNICLDFLLVVSIFITFYFRCKSMMILVGATTHCTTGSVLRGFFDCVSVAGLLYLHIQACVFSPFMLEFSQLLSGKFTGFTQKTGLESIKANQSQLGYMLLLTLNPNSPCTVFSKTLKT